MNALYSAADRLNKSLKSERRERNNLIALGTREDCIVKTLWASADKEDTKTVTVKLDRLG